MTMLAHIQKGRATMPRRIMLYGDHDLGKSTFGAMAERPIFINTEEGTNDIERDRLLLAVKYGDVLGARSGASLRVRSRILWTLSALLAAHPSPGAGRRR
jgi:hypothetical protein